MEIKRKEIVFKRNAPGHTHEYNLIEWQIIKINRLNLSKLSINKHLTVEKKLIEKNS